jgi:DNA-binding NtrC family response regulator
MGAPGGTPPTSARNSSALGLAQALRFSPGVMNAIPQPTASPAAASPAAPVSSGTPAGFHGAVSDFKRRLIEATLHQMRGNRTHTARALGLQRTYLLRLIRELGVTAPPPPPRRRSLAG